MPDGRPTQISMAGVSVFLAMPTHRDLSPWVAMSLLDTQEALIRHNIPFRIEIIAGNSLPHHARSRAAHNFLQSGCTQMFWVDSDIVWKHDDFLRILALGSKLACVGATYPAKQDPPLYYFGLESEAVEANEFGCLPSKGFGLGFTVVQRAVMEALAQRAPMCRFPHLPEPIPHIFRCDDDLAGDGNLYARGEDIAFFADVRALGHTIWLDPTINLGHVGPKTYTASVMDFLTQEQESNGTRERSPAQ